MAGRGADCCTGFPANLPLDAAATEREDENVDLTFAASAMEGLRDREPPGVRTEGTDRAVVSCDLEEGIGGRHTGSSI